MGREAAAVVFAEVIASVIAIAIATASWWKTEELETSEVHWQGSRWKEPWSAPSRTFRGEKEDMLLDQMMAEAERHKLLRFVNQSHIIAIRTV
jgi:hypothetical protein